MLREAQLISEEHVEEALRIQQTTGARLGSILVDMGAVSEATLLHFLSQRYGVPTAELSGRQIDTDLVDLIPSTIARESLVLPLNRTGSHLTVAMANPSDVALIDELRFRTGLQVIPMVAMASEIQQAIQDVYGEKGLSATPAQREAHFSNGRGSASIHEKHGLSGGQHPPGFSRFDSHEVPSLERLQQWLQQAVTSLPLGEEAPEAHELLEENAPIVNLVNELLLQAGERDASDIHIEPYQEFVRVRYRLDGVLQTVVNLPRQIRHAVVARMKIMANLNIAERRLPQDGRMNFKINPSKDVDVRISILPCLHGEKVVLRLLDQSRIHLDVTSLGMASSQLEAVLSALENPYGMILVTGPTGSGKTTTLYSALQFLNTPKVNIVTVEDPIEYHLTGVNQLQTKEEIGLTFPAGLRSFLRQDPDILMVGEIRDQETARVAIQAALTGHRILSTLHTNDAPRAITRLLDMGIEPFLVSSSLSLIIAQRLVRTICTHCKETVTLPLGQLMPRGLNSEEMTSVIPMQGKGCEQCHYSGFRGRMALFEVLPLSDHLHAKILERAPANDLKQCAMEHGFTTLRQSGFMAIKAGLTTVDEVVGATMSDSPSCRWPDIDG